VWWHTSIVAACMTIARDVFRPSSAASTITKSRHPWWMRERAAVRPAGPAPTISTAVLSGRDIILRKQKDKMRMTVRDFRKAFMLVRADAQVIRASIKRFHGPRAILGTKNETDNVIHLARIGSKRPKKSYNTKRVWGQGIKYCSKSLRLILPLWACSLF